MTDHISFNILNLAIRYFAWSSELSFNIEKIVQENGTLTEDDINQFDDITIREQLYEFLETLNVSEIKTKELDFNDGPISVPTSFKLFCEMMPKILEIVATKKIIFCDVDDCTWNTHINPDWFNFDQNDDKIFLNKVVIPSEFHLRPLIEEVMKVNNRIVFVTNNYQAVWDILEPVLKYNGIMTDNMSLLGINDTGITSFYRNYSGTIVDYPNVLSKSQIVSDYLKNEGILASDCIFFDDRKNNCEDIFKLNIISICYNRRK